MPNAWFRFYHEWDSDPKVQMMSEAMQRRLAMLFCWRCRNETFQETRAAFHWRITPEELAQTKAIFMANEFIDENWNLLNWNRRQFLSDSSTDRVRRHRQGLKQDETLHETVAPVTVTPPDTDTDADTKKEQKPSRAKAARATNKPKEIKHSTDPRHIACKEEIISAYREKNGCDPPWDGREGKALGMLLAAWPKVGPEGIRKIMRHWSRSELVHSDRPGIWIPKLSSFMNGPIDRFNKPTQEGNGNGRTNGNHPSPAKQRVDANRRALAEVAIKRGWLVPDGAAQPDGEEVSESGFDGRHTGVPEGSGAVGPEILPPSR